ncbi:TnsD family Tn7-like transposition protein [Thalassotalea sp. Y01]|uniref:TnsD family Tn7-like transposition protein n=1 Tax=Thalassotalea sp. Y01 TaxID=2729613 RepID=UPI00145CDB19|nr:TnsD family Tn7-like transposition protein [Thalassotalea sp. Y01]NMP16234.1 transposase [Thalassotalea sp. Y01]
MINFPSPLPDELLYSVLARARVKYLIRSPKALIQRALFSRGVIASLNFPSHISALTKHYLDHDKQSLIYGHTLFPLYAPFIREDTKHKCLNQLYEKSDGTPHLASGYAASRLPKQRSIRYCQICIEEQRERLGEAYWQRIHQIVGITTCVKHNCTLEEVSNFDIKRHRHEYLPASSVSPVSKPTIIYDEISHRVTPFVEALLNTGERISPSHQQWTQYYRELIQKSHCCKGQYCSFELVIEKVLYYWPVAWLNRYNLWPLDTSSSWLHGITRKHRKSFSYLEHIIILHALHEGQWNIESELADIGSQKVIQHHVIKKPLAIPLVHYRQLKMKWLKLVKAVGTKRARNSCAGGLYMQLYRNQHDWLMKINKRYQRPINNMTNRVNWRQRDIDSTKYLIKVRNKAECDLSLPRLSKLWFLQQLPNKASIEKNLNKLPLTLHFLNAYQETVTEYQVRRIARTLLQEGPLPSWVLLRRAGLSEERMTSVTRKLCESHGFI